METIKKIGLLFLAFFSFVCIVGGIGTLYYCQVESSNLFATGLIPVGAIYFYLLWPTLKSICSNSFRPSGVGVKKAPAFISVSLTFR